MTALLLNGTRRDDEEVAGDSDGNRIIDGL
jgi:hypothetical protein